MKIQPARRTRMLGGALALAIAGAMTLCVQQSSADPKDQLRTPAASSPAETSEMGIYDEEVIAMGLVLEDLDRLEGYGDAAAGMIVDDNQKGLRVFYRQSSPNADSYQQAVRDAVAERVDLTFEPREYSVQELNELAGQIIADTELTNKTLNAAPSAVEVDIETGTLIVKLPTSTNESRNPSALAAEVGVPITISSSPLVIETQATSSRRSRGQPN